MAQSLESALALLLRTRNKILLERNETQRRNDSNDDSLVRNDSFRRLFQKSRKRVVRVVGGNVDMEGAIVVLFIKLYSIIF